MTTNPVSIVVNMLNKNLKLSKRKWRNILSSVSSLLNKIIVYDTRTRFTCVCFRSCKYKNSSPSFSKIYFCKC